MFNSAEACNKWFWFLRDGPSDRGLIDLSHYMIFWGYAYFLVTALLLTKSEDNKLSKEESLGIKETYMTMRDLLRLPRRTVAVRFSFNDYRFTIIFDYYAYLQTWICYE